MIALDVPIHCTCPHCTCLKIRIDMAAGFSKKQIEEAIMEAELVSSGTQMFRVKEVYDKSLLNE